MGTKKFWEVKTFCHRLFSSAFLMRQPDQKKLAWIDLKMVREKN